MMLAGQYAEERPHWFSKYWHAHTLNSLGLRLLFLDDDVVVFQDPFQFHDRSYDIEGYAQQAQRHPDQLRGTMHDACMTENTR